MSEKPETAAAEIPENDLRAQWNNYLTRAENANQREAALQVYYDAETAAYDKILTLTQSVWEGPANKVAEELGLPLHFFIGFCDGIATSVDDPPDLEEDWPEDKPIRLSIEWEKLYYNMLSAKAPWLYELPSWNNLFSEAQRHEILLRWRADHTLRVEKKPGRNDPCACGSGRKSKHCCG